MNYGYDAVDQLVDESATGGASTWNYTNTFAYDAMGNRTRGQNVRGGTTTTSRGSSNALNQLTALSRSSGGVSSTNGMSYDLSGNLTQTANADGSKTLYTYDDADRLTRLETRNAAGAPARKSEWVYDYAGRKVVTREFVWTNNAWFEENETRRVFDGMDVVQERNDGNKIVAQYTRNGNIGGILARTTEGGSVFYGYDGGGNVTLLTDETGAEVGRYSYDAFGNTLEASGPRAQENLFRFSTKELHAASGLYDYGYRFYSTSTGRWLNRDPIAESGGLNLYAALSNSPVNAVDAYGLDVMWARGPNGPWGKPPKRPFGTFPPEMTEEDMDFVMGVTTGGGGLGKIGAKAAGNLSSRFAAYLKRINKAKKPCPPYQHPYKYHPRIRQRSVEDPKFHNFPYSFDDVILAAKPVVQGDGSLLYRVSGYVNGISGVFEIAVNPRTGIIFHRTFNASKNLKTK